MSVSFDALNIHGLLVLLNAFVKISYVFIGGWLPFLLCAHLSWETQSPRSLSELVSHAPDSKVTWHLSIVSFLKCSWVTCWKVTAHLLCFTLIILLKNFYWCQFMYYDWLQPPSTLFSWAFSVCNGIRAAAAFLTSLLCPWQPTENGLLWTELNLKMYERSTFGDVHGELFLTIQFPKPVKYWNIKE